MYVVARLRVDVVAQISDADIGGYAMRFGRTERLADQKVLAALQAGKATANGRRTMGIRTLRAWGRWDNLAETWQVIVSYRKYDEYCH